MENYWMPLLGGVLIGLSSSTMLGGLGRITGISGILGVSLSKPSRENNWRYAFLAGLIGGGALLLFLKPGYFDYSLDYPIWQIIGAGLLVGFGTRLGSGCTSGHGVCGLARTSGRSLVATVLFILSGMLMVAVRGIFS
ncbi:YeeE/YedE family protein [bacterium]|nr:YeeE/YedE family protein [bacterium]